MAVLKTLTINGVTYTVAPLISNVLLRADAWEGSDGAYYQVVDVPGVTSNSKVNLQLGPDQVMSLSDQDIYFTTENNGGVVTVHAIGDKPQNDYTFQATIKVVTDVYKDEGGNVVVGGGSGGGDGFSPTVAVNKSGKVTTVSITDKNGTKTATINDGADGKTPVAGVDYFTEADKAEMVEDVLDELAGNEPLIDNIAEVVKAEVPLVKSAEQPTFVSSTDEMTDKTKVYVMPDGYLYGYAESENYNLLKLSEVSFQSRLDNTSSEIVSSTTNNVVTGWFPVTYGKYYSASIYRADLGRRVAHTPNWNCVQLKLKDGTIKVYTNASGGNEYPSASIKHNNVDAFYRDVDDENAVFMRIHFGLEINGVSQDISTATKFKAFKIMVVEGNTPEEAASKAIDLEYIDGDAEGIAEWYNTGLAYNQPAEYEGRIVELESDVSTLQNDLEDLEASMSNPASASPYYRNVDYGVIPTAYYQGVGTSYDAEGFDRNNTKYATFIAAWKSLVANHSTYVTETELGKASDGQSIYLYDFKPARITNQHKPIPKVIIVAGQHGWEKANVYGLYYFVGNLLNRWTQHPALEYLRNHVELMIVPVVNTYGFDNITYTNANGVNINRNYSYNWVLLEDTTSDQYGGAEPFDQPESQIIRDLILMNTRAALVIDCHSCHHYNPETIEELTYLGVCNSNDSYYNRMLDVASHHFSRMSAHFNVDYEMNQPDVIMGFLTKDTGNGILRSWVTSNNIVGVLVEGLQGFYNGESFVGDVYKADEEYIVNYLVTALNYLSE